MKNIRNIDVIPCGSLVTFQGYTLIVQGYLYHWFQYTNRKSGDEHLRCFFIADPFRSDRLSVERMLEIEKGCGNSLYKSRIVINTIKELIQKYSLDSIRIGKSCDGITYDSDRITLVATAEILPPKSRFQSLII